MEKKGGVNKTVIILIIGILLICCCALLVGGGVYLYTQNQLKETPFVSTTPTTEPTVTPTPEDDDLTKISGTDYVFYYPKDYTVGIDSSAKQIKYINSDKNLTGGNNIISMVVEMGTLSLPNPTQKDCEGFSEADLKGAQGTKTIITIDVINDSNMTGCYYKAKLTVAQGSIFIESKILVKKGSTKPKEVVVVYAEGSDSDEVAALEKAFDQSTLK